MGAGRCRRQDVGHEVGIDPAHHAGVDISDLEEGEDLRVPCSAIAVQDQSHPPVLVVGFAKQGVVPDDHGHPWLKVEKDRTGGHGFSTDVLMLRAASGQAKPLGFRFMAPG